MRGLSQVEALYFPRTAASSFAVSAAMTSLEPLALGDTGPQLTAVPRWTASQIQTVKRDRAARIKLTEVHRRLLSSVLGQIEPVRGQFHVQCHMLATIPCGVSYVRASVLTVDTSRVFPRFCPIRASMLLYILCAVNAEKRTGAELALTDDTYKLWLRVFKHNATYTSAGFRNITAGDSVLAPLRMAKAMTFTTTLPSEGSRGRQSRAMMQAHGILRRLIDTNTQGHLVVAEGQVVQVCELLIMLSVPAMHISGN